MDEISRMEKILRGDPIEPITRLEKFCAKAAGTYTGDPLTPVTRLELFLDQISGGGGGGPTLATHIFSVNTYPGTPHMTRSTQEIEAPEGIAYNKIWNYDEFISYMTFSGVNGIKHLYVNKVIVTNMLYQESHFESVAAGPSCSKIWNTAFYQVTNLKDVILYADSVVELANINAFQSTPFASGGSGGTLWVPNALISSYQAATNWSTILGYANNQIKAIEGSEWE